MKARGLITEIEVPATWDDNGTTRQTSAEYPFVYKDPVSQTGTYTALRVDWGDGSHNDYTTGTYHTHSYTSSGRFTVKYSSSNGILPNMTWPTTSGSPEQLRKISFANFKANQLDLYFHNFGAGNWAPNIEYLTFDYLRNSGDAVVRVDRLFRNYTHSVEVTYRRESFQHNYNLTGFTFVFNRTNITYIDETLIGNLNNVVDFNGTFWYCTGITEIPEGLFDNNTSVTTFQGTFSGCTGITEIPEGLFDNNTSVTTFEQTFYRCRSLSGQFPDGIFDNNIAVTSFNRTFTECSSLTGNAPDLWVTHSSADGTRCFTGCNFDNQADIPAGWK